MDPEKIAKLKIERDPAGAFSKRRGRKLTGLLVAAAVAGVLAAVLFQTGLLNRATPVRSALAALVPPSQVLTDFNASGYVVAQRKAAVASKGTGRLVYLGVQEGSRAKEGDILARIDSDDVQADKAQAEAQLVQAKHELERAQTELSTAERNHKRFEDLVERKAASQLDFENARDRFIKAGATVALSKAAIRALEAALNRSTVLLEYTNIRAPFDGVVLTKNADVGEVVAPFGSAVTAKAAVVTMADLSSLMVEADVAEAFLSRVKAGQPCEVQLDAIPDTRFKGKVAVIVPTADRTRGTVMVKVRFDELDPRILPEMSARVAFLSRELSGEESRPFLAIHRDALATRAGGQGFFLIEGDHANWVPVPNPAFLGDYLKLEKLAGAGDRIVLKPPAGLEPGDLVKEAETK
jgi:RND family efflux transporter MFP subunit